MNRFVTHFDNVRHRWRLYSFGCIRHSFGFIILQRMCKHANCKLKYWQNLLLLTSISAFAHITSDLYMHNSCSQHFNFFARWSRSSIRKLFPFPIYLAQCELMLKFSSERWFCHIHINYRKYLDLADKVLFCASFQMGFVRGEWPDFLNWLHHVSSINAVSTLYKLRF